jgi:hypothetical protein
MAGCNKQDTLRVKDCDTVILHPPLNNPWTSDKRRRVQEISARSSANVKQVSEGALYAGVIGIVYSRQAPT